MRRYSSKNTLTIRTRRRASARVLPATAGAATRSTIATASSIAAPHGNAPLSIAANKATIDEILKDPAERDMARIDELSRRCFDSADYAEGRRAFMEKRKPVWTGR